MYKLILNNQNKTELLVKDLLTSVIAIVIEDESRLYQTKQLLTDNVFYDATMYTEDGSYVGKITKKITPDSPYRSYTVDGVCYGEFNVTTVTTQEGKIINLTKELSQANNTIEELNTIITSLTNKVNGVVDTSIMTLEEAKSYQKSVVNKQCQDLIYSGIDVEFTTGIEHFSLTIEDQTNIKGLYDMAKVDVDGTGKYPYHSDSNPCKLYTRDEIILLYEIGQKRKTFLLTVANAYHLWIETLTDKESVLAITFAGEIDETLPEDIKANLTAIFVELGYIVIEDDTTTEQPTEDAVTDDTETITEETPITTTEGETNE